MIFPNWSKKIKHGGDLSPFIQQFSQTIPWVDLSSATSPYSWLHSIHFSELPWHLYSNTFPNETLLMDAAKNYYECRSIASAPGVQSVIWALPNLWSDGRKICIFSPTYQEHEDSWSRKHYVVKAKTEQEFERHMLHADICIITNPNNPTGKIFPPKQLLSYHRYLKKHEKTLIIDESFIDTQPHLSLTRYAHQKHLIVLRSVGKFFGAPGLRVGFFIGCNETIQAFKKEIGIWMISGLSCYLASKMLLDSAWQKSARILIQDTHQKMHTIFKNSNWNATGKHDLFFYFTGKHIADYFNYLAKNGFACRVFHQHNAIRIGLCHTEQLNAFEKIITRF